MHHVVPSFWNTHPESHVTSCYVSAKLYENSGISLQSSDLPVSSPHLLSPVIHKVCAWLANPIDLVEEISLHPPLHCVSNRAEKALSTGLVNPGLSTGVTDLGSWTL